MAKRTTTEKPASSKAPATKKQENRRRSWLIDNTSQAEMVPRQGTRWSICTRFVVLAHYNVDLTPIIIFAALLSMRLEGSKPIPEGKENCLAGLTFVFTGELESLSREDAQSLCKRYGGRVTTSPSSKTSYVVLGSDAGPKKLEMIKKHKIKTITEDEFLALIGSNAFATL
ncbi:hypothetical protein KEM48_003717 [Puccinia striiformis f. sp. tritici PST-130]|nr:hypothetical protein KEM48_003717 [Puccinia striiformis f. sp. tritici PST-130]